MLSFFWFFFGFISLWHAMQVIASDFVHFTHCLRIYRVKQVQALLQYLDCSLPTNSFAKINKIQFTIEKKVIKV